MKTPFGKQASGLRLERMRGSPRYRDGEFRNLHPILPGLKGSAAMPSIGDFICSGGRRVPSAPLPTLDPRPSWGRAPETGLRVTWLGHSTLFMELDGVRLLTDPVWGERVSPVGFAGPKRFHPVPVQLAQLPPLDAVIVSHDHYDHLDYPTILELAKTEVPLLMPQLGEAVEPSRADSPTPWWRTPGKAPEAAPVSEADTSSQPLDPSAPLAWPLD
jgi:hypothetical protein